MKLLPVFFLPLLLSLSAQTIYTTEFEEFAAGGDWVGSQDWIGVGTNADCQGIDGDLVSGLGKTAFIGFERPAATLSTVAKRHNFDPLAVGRPEVQFEALIGIEDSTSESTPRDTFKINFYNAAGDFLASVNFRNSDNFFGVWYSDGVMERDTNVDFLRGELLLLTIQINFATNRWSAQLDGVDLFLDQVFHAGGQALDLGLTAAQWELTSGNTLLHGDNYLLIADWTVRSVPTDLFHISSFSRVGEVNSLVFPAAPGFRYQLFGADTLEVLLLPDQAPLKILNDPDSEGFETLTDPTSSALRFYRVVRDFSLPLTE